MAHVQMVDVVVPRALYVWMIFDSVRDPLANLAPLGDPIPIGGPHFHRIVINLPRCQRPGDGGEENLLTHRASGPSGR
jgi:hypothetical protein